jgi:hypothetical protein
VRAGARMQPEQSSVDLRKEIGSGSRADWFQPVANGIEKRRDNFLNPPHSDPS